MTIFNFGRKNRLFLTPMVSTVDYETIIGFWLNGRVFNKYISYELTW